MQKYKLGEVLFYEQPTKYIVENELYNANYKTPVLTAGKSFILGYTNEKTGIYENLPCIIFDDFTTAIKYVDFPFKVRSSAMKILTTDNNHHLKYLYYFLSTIKVDVGLHKRYWISRYAILNINLPPLSEQERIAKELDAVCGVITKQKEQYRLFDELIKSRFVEMFEGNNYHKLLWNDVFNTKTGKLDSNAMVPDGKYPFFTCAKEIFNIDEYAFDQEALLLAGNNAAGKYDVKHYKGKFNAYQRTYVLSLLKDTWSYRLFQHQLQDKLGYLQEQSKGSNTRYITLKILSELEFIVPPIELQQEFTTFVQQVDKLKLEVQKSLNKTETLYKALMQKYFG